MTVPTMLRPLDYLKRLLDRRFVGIRLDPAPPTLLTEDDLQGADVLFCRGGQSHIPWRLISYGSSGPYVHVAIYLGIGEVAEATTEGVKQSWIGDLTERYEYIAVTRCPGVHGIPALRSDVINFCKKHIKEKRKYAYIGAFLSPIYELLELAIAKLTMRPPSFNWPRSKRRTFCSQFVLDAFVEGGYIPKDYYALGARSPTALAEENCFQLVGYLSQLKNIEPALRKDVFWTGGG